MDLAVMSIAKDVFWADDINVLFKADRLIEFFPTDDMSENEKLNAITRFFIYLSVALFIIYKKSNLLLIAIVAMVILYIVHYNRSKKEAQNNEEFTDKIKEKLNIDKDTPIKVSENGDICQLPSKNNPFMNVLLTDYTDNPNRPPACAYDDQAANELKEKFFDQNLYKDVEDVWNRRNSQREFVSMPSTTIPNDRDSFMKWCWGTTYVCKDGDLNYCVHNEDLRVPGYS